MSTPCDGNMEVMPPGFGLLRIQETGTSTHELIYEHEYFPQPVHKLSAVESVVDVVILRPAIRNGKVDFNFYGNRVPLTADHARCWLGHILLQEVQNGLLAHVEFVVQQYEDLLDLQSADHQHGPQPTWQWDVWLGKSSGDGCDNLQSSDPRRHSAVKVIMNTSPACGVTIEVESSQEALAERAEVFRVLKQYCDEDPGGNARWHPIPASPGRVSKIISRSCTDEVKFKRMLGLKLPETGLQTLHRSLSDWKEAESRLVDSIARAQFAVVNIEAGKLEVVSDTQAVGTDSGLRMLIELSGEVWTAFDYASRVGLKLRPEWGLSTTAILETLLRLAFESKDAELLHDSVAIANSMCDVGVPPPPNLADVERHAGWGI